MGFDTNIDPNFDHILTEIGEFGPYQVTSLLLASIIRIITATSSFNYIISGNTLNYRYVKAANSNSTKDVDILAFGKTILICLVN